MLETGVRRLVAVEGAGRGLSGAGGRQVLTKRRGSPWGRAEQRGMRAG